MTSLERPSERGGSEDPQQSSAAVEPECLLKRGREFGRIQEFGWGTEVFKPGEADYTMISSVDRATAASARRWKARRRRTGSVTSKIGRLAVLRDRQGATFGIIKPEPAS